MRRTCLNLIIGSMKPEQLEQRFRNAAIEFLAADERMLAQKNGAWRELKRAHRSEDEGVCFRRGEDCALCELCLAFKASDTRPADMKARQLAKDKMRTYYRTMVKAVSK